MTAESAPAEAGGVSTLELFFDLVFVFTITQLTAVLTHHPNLNGLARVALMLGVIWWMYGGYAWLTNAVVLDGLGRRGLLLGGMAAYLVLALTIPRAFTERGAGIGFGLAYLVIVLIHSGLFTRASGRGARGILRIAPFNVASALLILAGGALGGPVQYALWALAFAAEWATPLLVPPQAFFEIQPGHFVERHGLVVLIAIGESVVAIGIGASLLPFNTAIAGVAVLGLALTACLWWAYFGQDDGRAESALTDATDHRPGLALRAFGLWHLPVLLGIVAIAFGLKQSFGHAFAPGHLAPALGLAVGATAFLAGDVLFRTSLGFADGAWRTAAAILALATLPVATLIAPAAQIGALVILLTGALAAEGRATATDSTVRNPDALLPSPADLPTQ